MTLLLTGATGTLGLEILKANLKYGDDNVIVLLRGTPEQVTKKYRQLLYACSEAGTNQRKFKAIVKPVRGDVSMPNLGMTETTARKTAGKVTGAIHCAADIRFNNPLQEAVEPNLEGTRNMLVFLSRCSRLNKFGYVSTAYVSGKRTGRIMEGELEHEAGFVNDYEHSKYKTELLLRGASRHMPIAVYRTSIMLSNSNGQVTRFGGIHKALELLYNNLITALPGHPKTKVNIVPSDSAAKAILRLFDKFKKKTYHICADDKETFTIEELLDESINHFKKAGVKAAKPSLVSVDVYESMMQAAQLEGDNLTANIMRFLKMFTLHLACPKIFDTTNLKRDLGNDALLPDVRQYFECALDYCIRHSWGKK